MLARFLIVFTFSILMLPSCRKDVCIGLFGEDELPSCLSFESSGWDSILIVGPYIYPDEVERYTGLSHDFDLQTDPYSTFIYMRKGEVLKEKTGSCSGLTLSTKFKVADGILVLKSSYCYDVKRTAQGAIYVSPH